MCDNGRVPLSGEGTPELLQIKGRGLNRHRR